MRGEGCARCRRRRYCFVGRYLQGISCRESRRRVGRRYCQRYIGRSARRGYVLHRCRSGLPVHTDAHARHAGHDANDDGVFRRACRCDRRTEPPQGAARRVWRGRYNHRSGFRVRQDRGAELPYAGGLGRVRPFRPSGACRGVEKVDVYPRARYHCRGGAPGYDCRQRYRS